MACIETSTCLAKVRGISVSIKIHAILHARQTVEADHDLSRYSWLRVAIAREILVCKRRATETPAGAVREMAFVDLEPGELERPDAQDLLLQQCPTRTALGGRYSLGSWQRGGISLSLGAALRRLAPNSTVVIAFTRAPDIGSALVAKVARLCAAQGIQRRRVLVLHSRSGRLPRLGEAWWSSYWPRMLRRAQYEFGDALCQERRGGQTATIGCNASARTRWLDRWCARPAVSLRRGGAYGGARAAAAPNHTFLLLGGDAHYGREHIVLDLFRDNLLESALWSLAMPRQCVERATQARRAATRRAATSTSALAGAWEAFCDRFSRPSRDTPRSAEGGRTRQRGVRGVRGSLQEGSFKNLDIELGGGLSSDSKDRLFAPAELHQDTRFALVIESVRALGSASHLTLSSITSRLCSA